MQQPQAAGEEKVGNGSKPANGTSDSSSNSQSGSSKKVRGLKTEDAAEKSLYLIEFSRCEKSLCSKLNLPIKVLFELKHLL